MSKYIKILIPFGAVLLFILGCEETPEENGEDSAVIMMVDSAITALEDEMEALSDVEVSGPGDIDFSTSNALFKEALALDPNNVDANFGAGLTQMLMFSQDPDVQAVFDAWEAFLDTGSAFVADPLDSEPALSAGFLLPGALGKAPIRSVNEQEVAYSYLNLFKLAVSDPPTIGDIQDVVEGTLLPDLEYALERLDIVDDSSSYVFSITPRMQGDAEEDTLEFDLTEVYVLETAINLIRTFFSVAVSYNIGPVSPTAYDSAAIIDLLEQGGDGFLSLRTNGAARMDSAYQAIMAASHSLDNAINFLQAETDDQSNDIITVPTEDADMLDSIKVYNGAFRDSLENGVTLTADWDDDETTLDEELTFNFSALFTNPIQDFKALLPDYSVSVGRDTAWDYGDWQQMQINDIQVTVNVPAEGFYSYYRNHWWDSWEDYEYQDIDTMNLSLPRVNEIVDSLLAIFRAADTLGHWDIGTGWYGWLNAGENIIYTGIWYGYEPRYPDWVYYTGMLSWDAETYTEWTFPDPTFNGFLPDIADDADFKATFGIEEEDFLDMQGEPLVIPFEFFSGGAFNRRLPPPLDRSVPWANRD